LTHGFEIHKMLRCARVAELADALDLGSSPLGGRSSSLLSRTNQ
jgi:hypothetical protein